MKRFIIGAITAWLFFFPFFAFANGGNIRIAEGKYLVNISSSPVTPIAGKKVAMLISFADVQKNELIAQDIRVWIEIRNKATQKVLFPPTEFLAERGVLEFSFTYPEAGLHELFIRFEKPDEPGKVYESEDFLVDVQESTASNNRGIGFHFVFGALLTGCILGWLGKMYLVR